MSVATSRGDTECTRMQLMLDAGKGEVNMGGRCKANVIEIILMELNHENTPPTPTRKRAAKAHAG